MKEHNSSVFRYSLIVFICFLILNAWSIHAQSGKPVVILVNGWQKDSGSSGCCMASATKLIDHLIKKDVDFVGVTYRGLSGKYYSDYVLTYSSFSKKTQTPVDSDAKFLQEGRAYLDRLSSDRPIIMIGHSFGGDSLLKLSRKTNKKILFLGLLDPVSTGGWRAKGPAGPAITGQEVPSNVHYFYNRWNQRKWDGFNEFPHDYDKSGKIITNKAKNKNEKSIQLAHSKFPSNPGIQEEIIKIIDNLLSQAGVGEEPGGVDKNETISFNWKGLNADYDAAIVHPNKQSAYFFKGDKYFRYRTGKNEGVNKEAGINDYWKGLPNNLDAAIMAPNGRGYFFKGDTYYRYNWELDKVDKVGKIKDGWKGLPNNIDAAIEHLNGRLYFFKGNQYFSYNWDLDKVDKVGVIGKDGWKGVSYDLDAAILYPNGRGYLFKKSKFQRFVF